MKTIYVVCGYHGVPEIAFTDKTAAILHIIEKDKEKYPEFWAEELARYEDVGKDFIDDLPTLLNKTDYDLHEILLQD